MSMALSLPTAARSTATDARKNYATLSRQAPRPLTTLEPVLHFADHYQQLLSKALSPISHYGSRCALGSFGLMLSLLVRTIQVIGSLLYYSIHLSRQAVWALWDGKHGRRLRKKIEFEVFTLILGGGNNLCLVLFWPGWCILGFSGLSLFVISTWYAG